MDVNSAGTFALSSEFWKFVVVLIPMTVITFALVVLLQSLWNVRQYKELKGKKAEATTKDAIYGAV